MIGIGVEGAWRFTFSVGDQKNIITELDDLLLFKIIERAGNLLPEFALSFYTSNEKVFGLLNEANNIKITYGRSDDLLQDTELVVTTLRGGATAGGAKRLIVVTGLYAATEYVTNKNMLSTALQSGVETIRDTVSEYFDIGDEVSTFNIEKSEDRMRWIQPNCSDKKFINDVWLHSYLEKSFISVGITTDGKFILKDMVKAAGEEYDWKFTQRAKKDNEIQYDTDFAIESRTGLINSWVGYGMEKVVQGLEDGLDGKQQAMFSPVLALTDQIAQRSTMRPRTFSAAMLNDNVHENFEQAYLRNLTYLAMLSTVKLTASFHHKYIPIKVLDLVMFKDDEVGTGQSAEYHSGLYFVSAVIRTINEGQFVTVVEMCRESMNGISGDKLIDPELLAEQTLTGERT